MDARGTRILFQGPTATCVAGVKAQRGHAGRGSSHAGGREDFSRRRNVSFVPRSQPLARNSPTAKHARSEGGTKRFAGANRLGLSRRAGDQDRVCGRRDLGDRVSPNDDAKSRSTLVIFPRRAESRKWSVSYGRRAPNPARTRFCGLTKRWRNLALWTPQRKTTSTFPRERGPGTQTSRDSALNRTQTMLDPFLLTPSSGQEPHRSQRKRSYDST